MNKLIIVLLITNLIGEGAIIKLLIDHHNIQLDSRNEYHHRLPWTLYWYYMGIRKLEEKREYYDFQYGRKSKS